MNQNAVARKKSPGTLPPFRKLLFVLCVSFATFAVSCKQGVSNLPQPAPQITDNPWSLQSIRYSYDGQKSDPYGWKTYVLNSGVLSFLGTLTISFTDSAFSATAALDTSYAPYFPRTLRGSCSGTYAIQSGTMHIRVASWSPATMFATGDSALTTVTATDVFDVNLLVLNIVVPVYGGGILAGHEYYTLTLSPS